MNARAARRSPIPPPPPPPSPPLPQTASWNTGVIPGVAWVWCVRSTSGAEGAGVRPPPGGAWPLSPEPGGGVFSHPSMLLAGCTTGFVRLIDRRLPVAAACVSISGEAMPAGHRSLSDLGAPHGAPQESAVAGLELAPHVDGFITTGFDGALRAWDARTMRPGRPIIEPHLGVGGDGAGRLARCALVAPDLIAAGSMYGTVKLYDFNWARALCT